MWTPPSRLYAVIDAAVCRTHGLDLQEASEACCRGGARFLQIRAKEVASRELLALIEAVVSIGRRSGATVIVNDRADLARLAGADGVHVGQEDLPPDAARAVLRHGIVGISTHDEPQVAEAYRSSADYIAVGPMYATATKETGYAPRGLDLVRSAASRGRPVVAIGGITLARAPEVLEAGAAAVAVISDLLATGDMEARVREFVRAIDGRSS